MTDPILDNLNPQQYAAVTAPDGPLLIVAGAGTGKTRVITRRLAHLVRDRGIRPWQMFAATFTNKAAEEMRHRVADLCVAGNPADFQISTFHSMCAKILRRDAGAIGVESNFTICDDKDQQSALKQVINRLGISDKIMKPSDAQYVINQCKMRMLGPDDVEEFATNEPEIYREVFTEYEKYLAASCAVDFEDLILKTVRLFEQNPAVLQRYQDRFRYVMVDEYQDTNKVQVELISLLAREHRNMTVVGDEDQSIYSWRGADINNLLDFQKHFPDAGIIRLEQNYRSTGIILQAADAVISNNTERLGKTLFTEGGDGPPIYVAVGRNDTEEAESIVFSIEELLRRGYRYSDMAIFYRVGSLSRIFEDALRKYQIPYRMIGGTKFYDRAEVKDLISYLQVAANPGNSIALQRIINTPRRGLGSKSVDTLASFASRRRVSLYDAILAACRGEHIDLPKGSIPKLSKFVGLVEKWRSFAADHRPSEILDRILEDTLYIESLGDPHSLDVIARTDNIEELRTSMITMETNRPEMQLTDYLENVSLFSGTDDLDASDDSVSLMTLHAAKGLEYKVVFMGGVEETLFPNHRSAMERGNFEEERRLFYVGITRAREILVLSRAAQRMYYSELKFNDESRFFHELPEDILRPLNIYNPEFHTSIDEAPKDVPMSFQPAQARSPFGGMGGGGNAYFPGPSSSGGPSGGYPPQKRRYTEIWKPFGAGPPPAPPRPQRPAPLATPSAAPASRGRSIPLGSRVRHSLLGEGVISGVSGSGSDLQYVIQMDDGTEHHLLARYARLEIVN